MANLRTLAGQGRVGPGWLIRSQMSLQAGPSLAFQSSSVLSVSAFVPKSVSSRSYIKIVYASQQEKCGRSSASLPVPACHALAPVPFLGNKISFPETSGECVFRSQWLALGHTASLLTKESGKVSGNKGICR